MPLFMMREAMVNPEGNSNPMNIKNVNQAASSKLQGDKSRIEEPVRTSGAVEKQLARVPSLGGHHGQRLPNSTKRAVEKLETDQQKSSQYTDV